MGYAVAIVVTFLLSVVKNSDVNASISYKERFDYSVLESGIQNSADDTERLYHEGSVENIKTIFEMFSSREKVIEKFVEVGRGDTLISVLNKIGLNRQEANIIYVELKKIYDVRSLKLGQKIFVKKVVNTKDNSFIDLQSFVIPNQLDERYIVEKTEEGTYAARVERDELLEEINSATGPINGTLSTAMNSQGVPNKIVNEFIKIFSFSVDFRRDVKKGDKFEIVYENYINLEGQVVKTGNILYASLNLRKDKVSLYRFKDKSGDVAYYNEKGLAMKKTLHRKPLAFQNARISSPFGKRRHPIFKDLRIHWGIDYAAPRGTAVYAAGDGVVQAAHYNGGYGKYVKIRHNSEYSTAYGHLNGYAKGIRPGVRVKQGQIIAYVGNTGRSTGPHLHYEVIQSGRRVNPLTIKASAGENLAGENLRSFKKLVAGIQESHKKMFASNNDKTLAQADKK